jgi:hypothetical protein
MSHIDSTGRAGGVYSPRAEEPPFDPAAILLALSAQQYSIMQSVATNQVKGALTLASRVASLGAAALTLPKIRDRVIANEGADIEGILARTKDFANRPPDAPVTENDLAEMSSVTRWAAERGYTLESLTYVKQPTSEEIKAAKNAGVDPPEPQTLIDQAALGTAIEMLERYASEVRSGEADNRSLRGDIAGTSGMGALVGHLRSLGFNGPLSSLSDLEQAGVALRELATATLDRLADAVKSARTTADMMSTKAAQVSDHLTTTRGEQTRTAEQEALAAQLEKQQMDDALRNILLEAQAELASVQASISSQTIDTGVVDRLMGNLSSLERQQVDKDLAAWKAEVTPYTATAPPLTPQKSIVAMRRDYM